MLVILIGTAWLAVVFFGLAMCRLAARSDDAADRVVSEWLTMIYLAEREATPDESAAEPFLFDPRRKDYRATG